MRRTNSRRGFYVSIASTKKEDIEVHAFKFKSRVNGAHTEDFVKAINTNEAKKIILARYPGAEIRFYEQID